MDQFSWNPGRGAIALCDSFMISSGCILLNTSSVNQNDWAPKPSLVGPYPRKILFLRPPYTISKRQNSDTLVVNKGGAIYLFRMKRIIGED